MLFAARKK